MSRTKIIIILLLSFFSLGTLESQSKTHSKKTENVTSKRQKRKIKKRARRNNKRKSKCPSFAAKKMEEAIKIYSNLHGVPQRIAFNIAYTETRYLGPHHKKYNPARISRCGALGPMQIMPRYAKVYLPKGKRSRDLLHDVYLNVEISMKMLAKLKEVYGTWDRAVAAYSSGNPRINAYSRKIMGSDFSKYWVKSKGTEDCLPDPPCYYMTDSIQGSPIFSFLNHEISRRIS